MKLRGSEIYNHSRLWCELTNKRICVVHILLFVCVEALVYFLKPSRSRHILSQGHVGIAECIKCNIVLAPLVVRYEYPAR